MSVEQQFEFRGFAYSIYEGSGPPGAIRNLEAEQRTQIEASLDLISGMNANAIILDMTLSQSTVSSSDPKIDSDYDVGFETYSYIIDAAAARNIDVFIKPVLFITDDPTRGIFDWFDVLPENPDNWFSEYKKIIVEIANFAQAADAKGVMIGSELFNITVRNEFYPDWQDLIFSVRGHFDGLVGYSAAASSATIEYQSVTFVEDLDFIGLSMYPELLNGDNFAREDVHVAWSDDLYGSNTLQAFKDFIERTDTPVFITEFNSFPISGGNQTWFEQTEASWNSQNVVVNEGRQQTVINGSIDVFLSELADLEGVFFWTQSYFAQFFQEPNDQEVSYGLWANHFHDKLVAQDIAGFFGGSDAGAINLNVQGSDKADDLLGGFGDDTIQAGFGDDEIRSGAGTDVIDLRSSSREVTPNTFVIEPYALNSPLDPIIFDENLVYPTVTISLSDRTEIASFQVFDFIYFPEGNSERREYELPDVDNVDLVINVDIHESYGQELLFDSLELNGTPLRLVDFIRIEIVGGFELVLPAALLSEIAIKSLTNNNTVHSGAGNDVIYSGDGNDSVIGGDGTDTVILEGNQDSYTLSISANETQVIDRRPDGRGTDTLTGIEMLDFGTEIDVFGAGPMNLDIFDDAPGLNSNQFAAMAELYIAYFNRAPDAIGLNFWASSFARGEVDLPRMAELFFDQPETRSVYASSLNEDGSQITDVIAFVTAIYTNVLDRSPDPGGRDFWVGVLEQGAVTPGAAIRSIIEGAKANAPPDATQAEIVARALDQQYLANATDIGVHFAVINGMSNTNNADVVMNLLTRTQESVSTAVGQSNQFLEAAQSAQDGEFLMPLIGVIDDPFG
ncbi:glycoside hydrolase family 113 [Marivita hallyeonensis]|uniref:DUF4214 domain-containing protein n=1 Tax=Marivita hallyeonensis TaxID=996342 RepID=A0A1M5W0B9_9RHOB|nr:DUF4214 domain-containing protein [Marivita hallyeonensis]SHH80868.1 protein of unknown function [Marivita hallyeonensis]